MPIKYKYHKIISYFMFFRLQAADLQVTFGLTDRSNPSVFFTQTRTVQNLYQYPCKYEELKLIVEFKTK